MSDQRRDHGLQTGDETLSKKLTLPLLLEDGRAPSLFASLAVIGCLFVCGAVIWGSITQIRQLAIAPGKVRPAGSARLVRHFEGGMVLKLLAREGELVARGAALISLQRGAATGDLEQLRMRAAVLSLRQRRLDAAINGQDPAFGKLAVKFPETAARQRAVLANSRKQAKKQRIVLRARIDRRLAGIDGLARRATDLARQIKIQKVQLKTRSDLLKRGLVSKPAFLELQRIHDKTRSEHRAMRSERKKALKALNEARGALLRFDADLIWTNSLLQVEIVTRFN